MSVKVPLDAASLGQPAEGAPVQTVKVSRHARDTGALGAALAAAAPAWPVADRVAAATTARSDAVAPLPAAVDVRDLAAATTTPITSCFPEINYPLTCGATQTWTWVSCGSASAPWISTNPSLYTILRNPGKNGIDLLEFELLADSPSTSEQTPPTYGCLATGTTKLADGTCSQQKYAAVTSSTLKIETLQSTMGKKASVVWFGCKGEGRVYLDHEAGTGLTKYPSNPNPSGTAKCFDSYSLPKIIEGGRLGQQSAWLVSPSSSTTYAREAQWCLTPQKSNGDYDYAKFSTSILEPLPGTSHSLVNVHGAISSPVHDCPALHSAH